VLEVLLVMQLLQVLLSCLARWSGLLSETVFGACLVLSCTQWLRHWRGRTTALKSLADHFFFMTYALYILSVSKIQASLDPAQEAQVFTALLLD